MNWLRSLRRRDEQARRGRHARVDEAADARLHQLAEPILKPLIPAPADPAEADALPVAKAATSAGSGAVEARVPGVEMGFGDGAVVPVTDEGSVRQFRQILERLFDQH